MSDLLSLSLFTDPSDDLNILLDQYNADLSLLLDKHAPERSKVITVRPANPCLQISWLSEESAELRSVNGEIGRKKGLALEIDR
jgi:hypothetical protein